MRCDLILAYKILLGMIDIPATRYFTCVDPSRGSRGHSYRLACNYSHVDVGNNFFSQCVVGQWNNLPTLHQDFKNLTAFKDLSRQNDLNELLLL